MNRKEVKSFLPILQAFADEKEIECRKEDKWYKVLEICNEMNPQDYRIKPEPKYRPFKNAEECWKEMQKHQPFGWIKSKEATEDVYFTITGLTNTCGFMLNSPGGQSFSRLYDYYTFTDGTPFGIKEEE